MQNFRVQRKLLQTTYLLLSLAVTVWELSVAYNVLLKHFCTILYPCRLRAIRYLQLRMKRENCLRLFKCIPRGAILSVIGRVIVKAVAWNKLGTKRNGE